MPSLGSFAAPGRYGTCRDADYSGLMLAARITLPHFSVSSAMSLPKSAGEPALARAAQVGKPRLHLGIGEGRVDLLVELVDDLGGRVLGCADAVTKCRLVARHEFADGRDVRQRLRARRRGYCQRAQLAGPDVLDRRAAEVKTSPAPVRRSGRSARARRRDRAHAPCRRRPSS